MKLSIPIIAVLASVLTTAASAQHVEPYEQLPFSSIVRLETCGAWRSNGHAGKFRFMVAELYGQDMLFVDMVRPNVRQTQLVVERGYTFMEFNNDHAETTFSSLRCRQLGANKIEIRGKDAYLDEKARSFRLVIDAASTGYKLTHSDR